MSKAKGSRRERQARELYEEAGYDVQPFYGRAYGETDGFGLFDLVAVRPQHPTRFVQVKSNRATGIRDWLDEATQIIGGPYAVAEYLVCHDREGWRLIQPKEDTYRTVVDERKMDCEMGEGVIECLIDESQPVAPPDCPNGHDGILFVDGAKGPDTPDYRCLKCRVRFDE